MKIRINKLYKDGTTAFLLAKISVDNSIMIWKKTMISSISEEQDNYYIK